MQTPTLDLAIVGGGPAGMSAALVAGRCRLQTAIINEEKPRNRVTTASHGFLTRDGIHPIALLQSAKEQLRHYATVTYQVGQVSSIEKHENAYVLRLARGSNIRAQRVIIATGHRDDLDKLHIPDIAEVYGTSVFPCPFCDAYEHSGERLAIFGGVGVEMHAAIVKMWSNDVAVFTNGQPLPDAARRALERNDVELHESKILRLDSKDGRLLAIRLENGARIERDAGFLWDQPGVPATQLADQLGVPRNTNPRGIITYEADDMGKTSVPGVYVVGDMRTGFSKLIGAAAEGSRVIERVVHDIAQERWK